MDEEQVPGFTKADLEKIGREWTDRIRASEKREKQWMDDAEEAENIYLMNRENGNKTPDFNILHSNVETIVPAIYNSTPRPEIRPRHNNREDRAGKFVADLYERAIMALIDDNRLDKEIEAGAQDAYTAGRDIVRIRFDADEQPPEVIIDPMTGEEYVTEPMLTNERIVYENVSWRDYREGPAKRWADVPWVAYGHFVSQEEKERLENPEYRAAYEKEDPYFADKEGDKDCRVWEIWCKETGRVYFVIEESARVLDIVDDPLGLEGFFPQGEPVQPITGTGKRTPVCPYAVYKSLAEELDTATRRIKAIMKGLKVRGVIAGDATVLETLAELDDNQVSPVNNIENLVAAGGLEKAVMWWPVEQSIAVLRELYQEREQTKGAIYEVTGISDIVRGQSSASETATAQQIKTQWGSLRIKKMQNGIVRQVRDLFVISAEVIAKHFSLPTIQKLAGVQIPPEAAELVSQWDKYRIDVESDSTIRADAAKNREEMSQFLQGTAQYMGAMQPLVQASRQAAGPAAKLYAAFASQFSLGKAGEDALDELITMAEQASQQPDEPSPEQQAEMAKAQSEQQKLQLEAAKMKGSQELERAKLDFEQQFKAADLRHKQNEAEMKQQLEAEKLAFEREKLGFEATRVAIEEKRANDESARALLEMETKEIEMAKAAFEEFLKSGLGEMVQELRRGQEQLAAGQQALADAMTESNRQIVEAMYAPRSVVKDENGDAVGVEIQRAN